MKRNKKQKGITLVALIITIIVLLILAVVAIRAVQGDGIIAHAKNARDKYSEAQDSEQDQIKNYLIYLDEQMGSPLIHSGIIRNGGTYTKTDGTILNAGDKFPDIIADGDIYIYGDYEYHYNAYYTSAPNWKADTTLNGWGVRVLDNTKEKYGPILECINGKNIVALNETFQKCKTLKVAPSIPNNVKYMVYTFANCENLTDISSVIIPDCAIDIHGAFSSCSLLNNISSLVIPGKVTTIQNLFCYCTSLTDASSLVIPMGVTNMDGTFYGCDLLKSVPVIPSSVLNMETTFGDSPLITGNVIIHANPTNYTNCFFRVDMSKITLTGSSNILNLIGTTGQNYTS